MLGYSVPQSADSVKTGAAEIEKFSQQTGEQVVCQDASPQFGQTDFSAQVAQMKDKGVDFLATSLDFNGDYSVANEMKKPGILDKVTFFHVNLCNADFVKKNAALFEGGIVLAPILAADTGPRRRRCRSTSPTPTPMA